MRLLDWNIEWMNNWFVGGGQAQWQNSHSGIANVRALAQRVANLMIDVAPDLITIQEGPSDRQEMQLFIDDCLSANEGLQYDQFGGFDGASQKTYMLVKRNGGFGNPQLANDAPTSALLDEWLVDVDGDLQLEPYEFTRKPLVLDGKLNGTSDLVRIVNLHTKSKFVNNQQVLWNDPNHRQEFVVAALKNRRRISAEAVRLRNYLDELVEADVNARIVVCGDFNDGPGLDYFERHYLTHGVADFILGSVYYPDLQFRHSLIGRVAMDKLFTSVFDDFVDDIPNRKLLLDHVVVSPALVQGITSARVCHQEYEAQEDTSRPKGARDRLPSDHRPVLVEFS
jgi:endonuclease/exonuclease/phosphatase family metal-dependent hydrolase